MKTWFKFYGQEFLSDPKMLSLTALERSLWLTLLCLGSASDEEGVIKYIDEQKIKVLTNLSPLDDEWDTEDGFLKHFEELGMIVLEDKKITISNFNKRQEQHSESYERVKKFREKQKQEGYSNVTVKRNDNAREEKNRIDKNRKEYRESSKSILTEVSFIEKLKEQFPDMDVVSEIDKMKDWLAATGKVKKDYAAFARNWLRSAKPIQKIDSNEVIVRPERSI